MIKINSQSTYKLENKIRFFYQSLKIDLSKKDISLSLIRKKLADSGLLEKEPSQIIEVKEGDQIDEYSIPVRNTIKQLFNFINITLKFRQALKKWR